MKPLLAALVLVLVAGCGGSDGKSASNKPTTAEPRVESTLEDVCPLVESVLLDPWDTPSRDDWASLSSDLTGYAEAADLETRNAMGSLLTAVQVFVDEPAPGSDYVDAMSGYTNSISKLAVRCKAVGSSALQ